MQLLMLYVSLLWAACSCFDVNITVNVLRGAVVTLDGVQKVTVKRGCWMELATKREKCPYYTVKNYAGYEQKDFYWYYRPEGWTHFTLIGCTIKGVSNCSLSTVFEGRVDRCDHVLKFRNAKLEDVGVFKSRIKLGKGRAKLLYYKLDVEVLSPVLVPVAQGKYNLLLKCCDRNSKAETFFIYNHPYGRKTRRLLGSGNRLLITQMNAEFPVDENIKCCSRWADYEQCGPNTFTVVDGSLCTETAPGRNWCQHRGDTLRFNELTSHESWKKRGSCSWTNVCKVKAVTDGVRNVCEGQEVVLNGQISNYTVWRKQRPNAIREKWWDLGSCGTCTISGFKNCSTKLVFTPNITDGGVYRQRTNWTVEDFNLTVVKSPGVMLQLDRLSYEAVTLTCVHGGFEPMKIQWKVDGSYEKFTVSGPNNETLTLEPDCWHSNKLWHAHVRVYCMASGYTWQGRSSQFLIENFRDGCAWRRKAGFHILMSHHQV